MPVEPPMIRANWTRMTLDFWKQKLAPETLRGALDAVGTATLACLDEAGPLEWLPVEHHLRVAVAPASLVRPLEYRKLWCDMVLDSFKRPPFRVIVEVAARSLKKTPADIARLVPRSFTLVGRGTGEMKVEEPSPRLALVTWSGIPARVRAMPDITTTWLGVFDALYDLSSHRGSAEMDVRNFAEGRVVYSMRW